jgi:hypothetical protein
VRTITATTAMTTAIARKVRRWARDMPLNLASCSSATTAS